MFCLSFFYLTSYAQITLSVKKQAIRQIIPQVEKASGYNIFYSNEIPDLNTQKAIQVKDASISEVLNHLFEGTNISYQLKEDKQILLVNATKSSEQKKMIKGQVTDKAKEPLIGATIALDGQTTGTITDIDGNFTLEAPENAIVSISYIGYTTKRVNIGRQSIVNVVLEEDAKTLDEVVIVGYGTQRKSDLTGAIVSVGREKIEMVSTPNLMDRLAGQVAGLNITTTNAKPGEEQTILIRGENSLSAENNPLIVLDGIPYSGALSDIDPDIIENLSVLKDASSAAIYGARGSNGVILIQTRKGKQGAARVTYKGSVSLAEPQQRLDMMNGDQFIAYQQDVKRLKYNWTGDQLDPEKVISASQRENYKNGSTTDWQDVVFRNAFIMNHQVSITGGTESTTYMGSVSHLDQEGVVYNSKQTRSNINLNVTQVLNKWLTIGVGTQFVQRETGGLTPNLEHALKQSPYGKFKDDNGGYYAEPMDNSLIRNPMVNVNADQDITTRNFFLNTFADILLPVKGLSVRTNFGYNYRSRFNGTYYGRDTFTGKNANGKASIANEHDWDYTWENIIKYNREFGNHRVDATGLFSIQETQKKKSEQNGEQFVNDDSSYYKMGAAEKNISNTSSLAETAMMSYMLRLNYSYAGKYMLTVTGRSDGYSAFGKNNKYAFFPSVAVAWNMAQENFMEGASSWLDQLKLRLSYGSSGNQAIKSYQTLDRLASNTYSKYIWGDGGTATNGAYLGNDGIGNPNLKWETTNSLNFAVDFSVFNSRLSGTIEVYEARTHDLLMKRDVPMMNGYGTIYDNVGKTRNRGIEIILNSTNIKTPDFTWDTGVTFSLNRDKIIDLRGDKLDDITNKWFIGKPLRVYYDYKVVGIWQEGDTFTYTAADGTQKEIQPGAKPGAAKLEDVDGSGYIDAKDKKVIGSKMPSFTMSMSNRLSYKNFYMSFLLNGTFNVTRELNEANLSSWYDYCNYLSDANYWTPETPNAKYASPAYSPYNGHAYYKKFTFVNIKNVTVGYNFERDFLKKVGIAGLGINLGINNLYTFCDVRSLLNYENSWFASYPTERSYVLGVNVTF